VNGNQELWTDHAESYAPQLRAAVGRSGSEVEQITDLLDTLDVERALDVGCGIGRHTVALAERGIDTTGIDIAEEYLTEARERAADASPLSGTTRFLNHDMRDLEELDDTYDLALCLFNTIGYHDDETHADVLAAVADRLEDGGAFVMSVNNRE
jgi:SAM-dependent methyltransferase